MSVSEQSGAGSRQSWPAVLGGMVGAGAGMALCLFLRPYVDIDGIWPAVLVVALFVVIGIVLGRLAGSSAARPRG